MTVFKSVISSLILILVLSASTYGQRNYAEEADAAFKLKQYYVAIPLYKKAYTKVKGNRAEKYRILYQIAECYRFTNDMRRAETQYKRLVRINYEKNNPLVLLHYADALRANQKYEEAVIYYNRYAEMAPDDKRGEIGAESCMKAQEWLDNPTRYEIEEEKKLNSRENDWAPRFSDKRKYRELVFSSTRENSTGRGYDVWTGQSFSDLYTTKMDRKEEFNAPTLLEEEGTVNSESNEGEAFFNKRGSAIYYTRCPNIKKEKLPCQIYTAKKRGRGWGEGEPIALRADSFDIMHPTISEDELVIYFASNMPGGQGGFDIWMAERTRRTKAFGKPINLGPEVNTAGHEVFPFLRYDTTLYFSSNGHLGIGGFDIYKTTKAGDKWSEVMNMKAPLNSPGDDLGITFKGGKTEEGYFSSNRKGGRGGDDIYYFILPPMLFTLSGVVRDENTLQFIPGASVTITGSDGSSMIATTDPKGFYKFDDQQIMHKVTYAMTVQKPEYFDNKGTATTVGLKESTDLIRDFKLKPIPEKPIPLPEIRYKLARWELLEQYQDSLIGLIQIMNDNPRLVIELQSHTDARPFITLTNDTLSQRRAQSVVDFLIERGIHPNRLLAKGYAARVPRTLERSYTYPESDQEYAGISFPAGITLTESYINSLPTKREREAAHQLNRRTTFQILRNDFVPPDANDTVTGGEVQLVTDPNKIVIPYRLGYGAEPTAQCVVNDITMEFIIDENIDFINFSMDAAMSFLREGRINKDDFVLKEKAIDDKGKIIENAVLVLDKLIIGDERKENFEVTVVKDLEGADLVFGSEVISELIGEYTIDKENKIIIFQRR